MDTQTTSNESTGIEFQRYDSKTNVVLMTPDNIPDNLRESEDSSSGGNEVGWIVVRKEIQVGDVIKFSEQAHERFRGRYGTVLQLPPLDAETGCEFKGDAEYQIQVIDKNSGEKDTDRVMAKPHLFKVDEELQKVLTSHTEMDVTEHGAIMTVLYLVSQECERGFTSDVIQQNWQYWVRIPLFPLILQAVLVTMLGDIVGGFRSTMFGDINKFDEDVEPAAATYTITALVVFTVDMLLYFTNNTVRGAFCLFNTKFEKHPKPMLTKVGAYALYLADLAVGVMTLYLGYGFLTDAVDPEDLLFNATALHFIVDIDDQFVMLYKQASKKNARTLDAVKVPNYVIIGGEQGWFDPSRNLEFELLVKKTAVTLIQDGFHFFTFDIPLLPVVISIIVYYWSVANFEEQLVESMSAIWCTAAFFGGLGSYTLYSREAARQVDGTTVLEFQEKTSNKYNLETDGAYRPRFKWSVRKIFDEKTHDIKITFIHIGGEGVLESTAYFLKVENVRIEATEALEYAATADLPEFDYRAPNRLTNENGILVRKFNDAEEILLHLISRDADLPESIPKPDYNDPANNEFIKREFVKILQNLHQNPKLEVLKYVFSRAQNRQVNEEVTAFGKITTGVFCRDENTPQARRQEKTHFTMISDL